MISDPTFLEALANVEKKFQQLISMKPLDRNNLPKGKQKGVYLFSEGDAFFYVGRTQNIRQRLRNHCSPSSEHNQAVFAFKLARHATGNVVASYSGAGMRKQLVQDPVFNEVFKSSKLRVSEMDFRFVEEEDQLQQTLLEIYAASVLKTPFNDFETH